MWPTMETAADIVTLGALLFVMGATLRLLWKWREPVSSAPLHAAPGARPQGTAERPKNDPGDTFEGVSPCVSHVRGGKGGC